MSCLKASTIMNVIRQIFVKQTYMVKCTIEMKKYILSPYPAYPKNMSMPIQSHMNMHQQNNSNNIWSNDSLQWFYFLFSMAAKIVL